jgi:hypothetical protein
MDEELAWAAGLLDGDGTIACNAGRYLQVALGSTDEELLRRFREAVGAGSVTGPYDRRSATRWSRKPQFFYQAYARGHEIVSSLWPMLGDERRQQALRAMTRLQSPQDYAARLHHLSLCVDVELGVRWPDRICLSWAAGFFDAEGCFSYSTRTGICASVTNTNRAQLERLLGAAGLGKIYGPYASRQDDDIRRKPHYFFRVQGHANTQALAAMLWFKLGTSKKRQAREVLARVAITCRRGHAKSPGHDGCAECTRAYWQARRDAKRNHTAELAVEYLIA